MAGVLAGGLGAVLSHRSAAAHWGIRPAGREARGGHDRSAPAFSPAACPSTVPTYLSMRLQPTTASPSPPFPGPCSTSPPLSRRDSSNRAVNEAEIRRLWDPLSLPDLLDRHPRRPGAAAIRAVIEHANAGITRSDLEDLFARFPRPLAASHGRRPTCCLDVAGRWIEADCVWREQRLIVELDGNRPCHEVRVRERSGPRPRARGSRLARDEDHVAPAPR